jgi:predicted permease
VGNRKIDHLTVIPVRQARIAPGEQQKTSLRLNIFLAVSGMVLVASCFNIANFLITRGTARRREFAIRISLGASRLRVIQQLLIEAMLISIGGGVAGILLASALLRLFGATVSRFLGIPLTTEVSLDPSAYGIAGILVMTSALVFGTIPTLLTSLRNPVEDLKNPKPSWTWVGFRISLRQAILALQVALAVMVAVTAGLYARSLYNINRIDTGYRTDSTLLARVVYRSITSTEARNAFLRDLLDRLRAHPNVATVTAVPATPFGFIETKISLPENPNLTIDTGTTQVGSGFFEASGMHLLGGREFDGSQSDIDRSVIINKVIADSLWPNQNSIGRVLTQNGIPRSVVGVVAFDRCFGLLNSPGPCLWTPFVTQGFQVHLRLRTRGEPSQFTPELRRIVWNTYPDVAVTGVETFDSHIGTLTANQRTSAVVSSALAFIGIALVVIGCFSLFASLVKDSAREIAIRIAVGATPRKVISTTVSRAFWLVVFGTVAGLAASVPIARRIGDQLFNVGSTDLATFIATALGMILIGVAASYWPARSAAQQEPITALRQN